MILFLFKIERGRVDAKAFASGLVRRVVKDMAEVATAIGAGYLYAAHAVAVVFDQTYGVSGGRIIKTGPAATAVEFSAAFKDGRAAGRADEVAGSLFMQ